MTCSRSVALETGKTSIYISFRSFVVFALVVDDDLVDDDSS